MPEKIIMTPEEIGQALARTAHEIIERNKSIDHVVLVGMQAHGVPLARRLGTSIESFAGIIIPVGALDFSRHRDDLAQAKVPLSTRRTDIPADINGKCVVLVDDVLNTGRSVRAAMDALIDLGRPQSIQLAVLIDCGHCEMPIRADYVGKNIPSARNEKIQVRLAETDGVDEVAVMDITA